MRRTRSYALVAIQFAAVICILYPTPIAAQQYLLAGEGVAIALGVWSIFAMRLGNVHILPDVNPHATLVTRGPYRFIRHPMYSAVSLYTLMQVADHGSMPQWIVWGVLCVDLIVKLTFEEGELRKKFSEYGEYCGRTKRLVPFVF